MLRGDVQHVSVFIFERDILFRAVRGLDFFRADDPPDAVRLMHRVIAHFGSGKHIPALAAYPPRIGSLRIQIARTDQRELTFVKDEPLFRRFG